jgi:hypothetical protein
MAASYSAFNRTLTSISGQRVWVVETRIFDWLSSVSKMGWLLVLNQLDVTVKQALGKSGRSKIIMIGHSQGGVLARLYLSPEPFLGRRFTGINHVEHLITLGSPHLNLGGLRRGGNMSRWIERKVPGSAFAPQVRYISVAGRYIHGNASGSLSERFAYRIYKEICAEGDVWGDGIVPVSSALLEGSQQIILSDVSHYSLIGEPWYGSEAVWQILWKKLDIP